MSRPPPTADRVEAPMLEPGTVFADRYEVLRRLGTGGMGAVYLARHREMGRLCAIKLLHPALSRDPEARERFNREARNACRIVHPNVCAVYDFGTTPQGLVFLVMEYVDGRPLGAILAEAGALPLRRTVSLIGEIAAGLDAAHELGIVHRDLKPDNVMVTGSPGRETVKLVDFGIAKAVEPEFHGEVTAAGVVVGTPEYMAPEQFAGDPADHRVDVYALGLVCYRMVSGTLPFRAPSARESLARRLTEPPAPLTEAAPGRRVPDGVQRAVIRALARAPAERFPSAGAFAAALRAVVAELPEEEAGPTVRLDAVTTPVGRATLQTRRLWRRGPVAILTTGVVALVTVAVLSQRRSAAPTGGALDTVTPPAAPVGGQEGGVLPATDSGGTSTAHPAAPNVRRAGPRLPVASPADSLSDLAALEDSGTRDAFRTREQQIYARPEAGPVRRAQAAFGVAYAFVAAARYDSAEVWGRRARAVNDSAPADAERSRRRERYESFLVQVRQLLEGRPIP